MRQKVEDATALTYDFSSNNVDLRVTNIRQVAERAQSPHRFGGHSEHHAQPYGGPLRLDWNDLQVDSDGSFHHPRGRPGSVDGNFYGPGGKKFAGVFETLPYAVTLPASGGRLRIVEGFSLIGAFGGRRPAEDD